MKILLPVIPLYPQQQEIFDAVLNNYKNFIVLMCHRRFGKDLVAWQTLIAYACKHKGIYYYIAPFRKQVKEIIIDGLMQNDVGTAFMDMLPDQLIKLTTSGSRVNLGELSIELFNGSKIFFRGADNIDGQVGVGATGVVFTEFDMISEIFYKKIFPIITQQIDNTGRGWMMFVSTPRGKNGNMANLFKAYMPQRTDDAEDIMMKKLWMMKFINCYQSKDKEGKQRLGKMKIKQDKYAMGEDQFKVEMELSFTGSLGHVWYGKQINKAYDEGRIRKYGQFRNGGEYVGGYWENLPVYIGWDWGKSDKTDLWFLQMNPTTGKPRLIYHYRNCGMTLDHYIQVIRAKCSEMRLGVALNIVPHDMNVRMDMSIKHKNNYQEMNNIAVSRIDYLRSEGMQCKLMDRKTLGESNWLVITRINSIRRIFSELEFDEVNCTMGIDLLKGYIKTWSKALGKYTDTPNHDANDNASDCADSFSTLMMYYILFLKKKTSNYHSYDYDVNYALKDMY